jgi:hypothetical protein
MDETVFIVKNCRLLKANFDDRQPAFCQKDKTLCHCDTTFPSGDFVVL